MTGVGVTGADDVVSATRSSAPRGEPVVGHIHPELAMRLIRGIWSAGLQLTALQALLDGGPAGDKAAGIVEELDVVIRDIRSHVLE